jgi:glycerol-3-phosphate acyltransferase PlsY
MDGELLRTVLLVGGAYLVGSVPTGVLMARLTGGRDPRTVGSGRTGGTNAFRAMGAARGLAVGLLDVGKGAVPVLVARWLGASDFLQALVGVAAVVGSWRSVFLGFHGGRGVASGIGAMLAIAPLVVLISGPVFLGVIALSRYVSLGSLLGSAAGAAVMLALVLFGGLDPVWLVFGISAAIIVWLAHADNIDRLLHGRERKFSLNDRERG